MNDWGIKTIQSMYFFIFALIVVLTPSVHAALFTGLGILPNQKNSAITWGPAISSDGTVVVGMNGNSGINFENNEAFRWTMETGMKGLGFAEAMDVSSDGSVVAGSVFVGPDGDAIEAVRWTANGLEMLSAYE